jgi:cystathionine beta-lyase/cystathionine gamma-synthase
VMANSYALPEDPYTLDPDDPDLLIYTRESGANQLDLQAKLAALEGGQDAVVFASGVAALHAAFFAHLNPGDHAIVTDVAYGIVWRLFAELLPAKMGVETTFVDVADLDAVRAAVRPNTRLVHTETIANPTTKVADVAALAEIAHSAGALLSVDSTFTPPPMYRPLPDGADLVVHSLSKYLNGHGDAIGGAVIGSRELVRPLKTDAMVHVGGAISPFNAWLIMRGSVTLPLRLRQHCSTAHRVAEFLATDPRVHHVAYPGLPAHPQHELARRQFGDRGFGGVLTFALDTEHDLRNKFVNDLRVITSAVSLGHDETLILYDNVPPPRDAHFPEVFRTHGLLRLAVGLEDPADLIADLSGALATIFGDPGRT